LWIEFFDLWEMRRSKSFTKTYVWILCALTGCAAGRNPAALILGVRSSNTAVPCAVHHGMVLRRHGTALSQKRRPRTKCGAAIQRLFSEGSRTVIFARLNRRHSSKSHPSRLIRLHSLPCQLIGAFVFGMSGVAFDPFPRHIMT